MPTLDEDVLYTKTIERPKGPVITQRAWTYPAFPIPGQQVRFRLFVSHNGDPATDTESIYVQDVAASRLTLSTTEGPSSAEIIDVQYATPTWSRQRSSSVLLAGRLSPTLIGVGPTSEPFRTRNGFGEVSAGAERGCLWVFGVRSGSACSSRQTARETRVRTRRSRRPASIRSLIVSRPSWQPRSGNWTP